MPIAKNWKESRSRLIVFLFKSTVVLFMFTAAGALLASPPCNILYHRLAKLHNTHTTETVALVSSAFLRAIVRGDIKTGPLSPSAGRCPTALKFACLSP